VGRVGPILSTVLVDAARNKLGWLRWERGDAGPLAVFATRAAGDSHYEVGLLLRGRTRRAGRTRFTSLRPTKARWRWTRRRGRFCG